MDIMGIINIAYNKMNFVIITYLFLELLNYYLITKVKIKPIIILRIFKLILFYIMLVYFILFIYIKFNEVKTINNQYIMHTLINNIK